VPQCRCRRYPCADLRKSKTDLTIESNEVERALRQLARKTGGEEQIRGLETRLASAKTDLVGVPAERATSHLDNFSFTVFPVMRSLCVRHATVGDQQQADHD